MRRKLVILPLFAVGALLTMVFTAPAAIAGEPSVTPEKVYGDPKCEDYSKVPIENGVTWTQQGQYVEWSSTVTVFKVIVDGGEKAYVYAYSSGSHGDHGLTSPTGEIERVLICAKSKIELEKTGPASAAAGDTVTYTFKVTNTGEFPLLDVSVTDAKCSAAPVRVAGETDTSFEPGDVWTYTCSSVVPAGVSTVDNTAEACGTSPEDERVCDTDDHSFPVIVPVTTPQGGGTTPVSTPVGGGTTTVPQQQVLPENVLSGRARLRGPSGCVYGAFRASVTGRSIARVRFYVDGKLVKTLRGQRASYRVKVVPNRFSFGGHRVIARVKFTEASGTRSRTLRLRFARCARQTVQPRFTG